MIPALVVEALAGLIGRTRLCAVQRAPGVVIKRRRWWAPAVIWGAERLLRPRFRTWPLAVWQAREIALYDRLYGVRAARIPGGLRLPALPGAPLADFLRAHPDAEAAARAFAAAARALWAAHQVALPGSGAFTHGDATVYNCLYEPATGQARWFDFETGHALGQDLAWRRADDLRALLFSAGAWWEGEPEAWLALARAAYPDPVVWAAWRRILAGLVLRADPFHLAQTRLSSPASRALAARLSRQSAISN